MNFCFFFVTGKVEKIDLNAKITDIQKEIAKLKNDVKDFIVDNYIEIVPTLKKDQTLVLQAEKLADDIKELQRRVEDQVSAIVYCYTLKNFSVTTNLSLQ